MPYALVRGSHINYEVVGETGPWFVLTPGGRAGLGAIAALGRRIAAAGNRVLLHDRRNCGASDVAISADECEDAMFADDLAELLGQVGAERAIALGTAAGNRLCLQLALRHPSKVAALMLGWPVGGAYAVGILAETYYGQYIPIARESGMLGICETPHYQERIERNPWNRDLLLAMDVQEFISTMERWRQAFLASADSATMVVTDEQLRGIDVPTWVVPGLTDDPIHGRGTSDAVASLIPGAEKRWLVDERKPVDPGRSWLRAALDRRMDSAELAMHAVAFASHLARTGVTPVSTLSGAR